MKSIIRSLKVSSVFCAALWLSTLSAEANQQACRDAVETAQRVGLTSQRVSDIRRCNAGIPLIVQFNDGGMLVWSDQLMYTPFAGASYRCYDFNTRQRYTGTFTSCRR